MNQAIQRVEGASLEAEQWRAMREQAKALVSSGFLPKAVNTPEKAIAVALAGRELGLPMMQALRSIHIIDGKPVMAADMMAALVHRRIPGARLRVVESTNEVCTVEAARPGEEATRYSFTLEDAKLAGLLTKDNWRKYPRAMLRARAIAEAARATFPDAMMGVYDPDELGAVTSPDGEIVDTYKPPPIPTLPDDEPGKVYGDTPRLTEMLDAVETLISGGDLVNARKVLGSKAKPDEGDFTRLATQEHNADNLSRDYHRALGKRWQALNRQLDKLEAKARETQVEDAFRDPPDAEFEEATQ